LSEELSVVGQSLVKPDAFSKVSGQTKFADDLALPRMLFGRILRSPHPHARIVWIDASEALRLPGVHDVLTYLDAPSVNIDADLVRGASERARVSAGSPARSERDDEHGGLA